MKSPNFVDNANCPMKNDCEFYKKDRYDKYDVFHYIDYCLRLGSNCKLKKGLEKDLKNGK